MTGSGDAGEWGAYTCGKCRSDVYVYGDWAKLTSGTDTASCNRCNTVSKLSAGMLRRNPVVPAQVQMTRLIVETAAEADAVEEATLPRHLRNAHPALLTVARRYALCERLVWPLLRWVLAVAEEPAVHGSVRVYATLRRDAGVKVADAGLSWSLREAALRPLLPLTLSPDWPCAVVPAAATLFVIVALAFVDATAYPRADAYAWVIAAARVLGPLLGFVSLLALVRLHTVDPGYVVPASPEEQKAALSLPPEEATAEALREAGRCSTCRVHRPPRAGHCRVCGLCVERFDHHCNVLGQCIGRRNFGVFTWYVATINAALGFAILWWVALVGWWPQEAGDAVASVWVSERRGWAMALARIGLLVVSAAIIGACYMFTCGLGMGAAATLCKGYTARELRLRQYRDKVRRDAEYMREHHSNKRRPEPAPGSANPADPNAALFAARRELVVGDDGNAVDEDDAIAATPFNHHRASATCVGRLWTELSGAGRGPPTRWGAEADAEVGGPHAV